MLGNKKVFSILHVLQALILRKMCDCLNDNLSVFFGSLRENLCSCQKGTFKTCVVSEFFFEEIRFSIEQPM